MLMHYARDVRAAGISADIDGSSADGVDDRIGVTIMLARLARQLAVFVQSEAKHAPVRSAHETVPRAGSDLDGMGISWKQNLARIATWVEVSHAKLPVSVRANREHLETQGRVRFM